MFRNRLNLLVLLSVVAMLSSAAKAFSITSTRRALTNSRNVQKPVSFLTRSMSSTGESETSIVDICKEKISSALETEDVTVTGKDDFYIVVTIIFVPTINIDLMSLTNG